MSRFLIGLACSLILAAVGLWRRTFSLGGAAIVVLIFWGTFALSGWTWALPMAAFLMGMIAWHSLFRRTKRDLAFRFADTFRQGSREIAARLGWAMVLVILNRITENTGFYLAFVGALAAASADMWGTELGVLSRTRPRLITNGRQVRPGTAGAISALGIVAGIGASWLSGFLALLAQAIEAGLAGQTLRSPWLWLPASATIGGIAGSLTDSLLGAVAQAIYICDSCGRQFERPTSCCNQPVRQIRGWRWLTNNVVNLVSTIVGAAITATMAIWLAHSNSQW